MSAPEPLVGMDPTDSISDTQKMAMHPWNPRRNGAGWIESRSSGVRHFVDWRDNVFCGHQEAALQSRLGVSRARAAWFRDGEYAELCACREREGLPETDLASEDSEDALTWSVFSVLSRASNGTWWKAFGFERAPEVEFWPRWETSGSELASLYRRCGQFVEPHHRPDQRSEIDVLLSAPAIDVLVEAKWKSGPLSASKPQISTDALLDHEIRTHLARLAVDVLAPGVVLEDVLVNGAYQTLRHLLYAQALSATTGRPTRVAYVLRSEAIGAGSVAREDLDGMAAELFGGLFSNPLPFVVPWTRVLVDLDDAILDTPLPQEELHAGATFRAYLASRRVGGAPAPLVQRGR